MEPRATSLVELHHRKAHNYAHFLFPGEDEAGAVGTEALCHLATTWVERGMEGNFWLWAKRALEWRLTDWWRAKYGRYATSHRRSLYEECSLPDRIRQKADHESVEETVVAAVYAEEIRRMLPKVLTARELEVVQLRIDGVPLAVIAEQFDVTESRACQISTVARKKIRAALSRGGPTWTQNSNRASGGARPFSSAL